MLKRFCDACKRDMTELEHQIMTLKKRTKGSFMVTSTTLEKLDLCEDCAAKLIELLHDETVFPTYVAPPPEENPDEGENGSEPGNSGGEGGDNPENEGNEGGGSSGENQGVAQENNLE